jgi:hypothetical protein
MSALIGVCATNAVHLLTDAAITYLRDGRLANIQSKQILLGNGAVVTGAGSYWVPVEFAKLAAKLANFDEVREAAPEMWEKVRTSLPDQDKKTVCVLSTAGWSEKEARPWVEVFNADGRLGFGVFAAGPNDEPIEPIARFVERFVDDPDAFDPRRDGVGLMEDLRRYPRRYEQGTHPAVGGFVQHTAVTRDGSATQVLHNWSDLIGQHISLDEMPWPAPSGLSKSQFYAIREMCVLADWERAAGRPLARPEDHDKEWAQLNVAAIVA